jgi:hypothetical protein
MIQGIHALIDATETEPHRFPPTLLFNEGWMLRLVLDWFNRHQAQGHPLSFHAEATWFSEALLPSPFRARYRGDRRAETRTHADGIIGHIEIGAAGKAGAELLSNARQLVAVEAKIGSSLKGGTRNAPTFDQAARSVACIAEVLSRAGRRPDQMNSLGFLVAAPQANLDKGAIAAKLEKSSIEAAVRSRAQAFSRELYPWLEAWFLPTLERIIIASLSWESLISDIQDLDDSAGQDFATFYEKCLEYN